MSVTKPILAVGLMSGTSHDGISAALVKLSGDNNDVHCELVGFANYRFPSALRNRLIAAAEGLLTSATGAPNKDGVRGSKARNLPLAEAKQNPVHSIKQELSTLNFLLGQALGQAALKLIKDHGYQPGEITFIASHGHTFFHLPPSRARSGQTPSTLQLGESAVIAAMTGVPVLADFRPMDIAVGGEGAPLAPLAHIYLFGHELRNRVVQNIGGIANATYLPSGVKVDDRRVFAFDTGPGNVLIDALVNRISGGRLKMDRSGAIAKRGQVNELLINELLAHPYFSRKPPKSTGREEFGLKLADTIWRRAKQLRLRSQDIISTVTALTARSIAQAICRFVLPKGPVDELILTGGGAHNKTLRQMLSEELGSKAIRVMTANELGVNGDAVEAIAFAILGYETLRGRAGNIPNVTGAKRPAVLGKITLPPAPGQYSLISALKGMA